MADVFSQSTLTPRENRTDLRTAAIINSAIDMEATLGSVYAIVYMRRHNIDMTLALRVVLKEAERRMVLPDLPPSQVRSVYVAWSRKF